MPSVQWIPGLHPHYFKSPPFFDTEPPNTMWPNGFGNKVKAQQASENKAW